MKWSYCCSIENSYYQKFPESETGLCLKGVFYIYIFTVYALNAEKIEQNADARPELIGFLLNSHVIAKAGIMAYYGP